MQLRSLTRLGLLGLTVTAGLAVANGAHAQPRVLNAQCAPSVTNGGGSYARLVPAENGFGFRLLRNLFKGSPTANAFLSPTSVATALGMTYDGARGSTQSAMAKTLGINGLTQAQARAEAAALLAALRPSSGAGLSIANSLWAQSGTKFQSAFMQHARKQYGAVVRSLDLHASSAPGTINSWVSCATGGKIPSIIEQIPPQTILYLINAVYFSEPWQRPFNAADTKTGSFTTATGNTVHVPMMNDSGSYAYYKGASVQALSLPYKDSRFSMTIVLPASGTSLRSVVSGLSASRWKEWTSGMKMAGGTLSLPKFSVNTQYNLVPQLSTLGMGVAFSNSADFLGMCTSPCAITEVRHKAFLSVNEKGTVAAAASSVGISPTAIEANQFQMVVDHPFLVAISDRTTGAVLFTGVVTNPTG